MSSLPENWNDCDPAAVRLRQMESSSRGLPRVQLAGNSNSTATMLKRREHVRGRKEVPLKDGLGTAIARFAPQLCSQTQANVFSCKPSYMIVEVEQTVVVKYGPDVNPSEAESMQFV